jgi:hypothetical protein
LSENSLEIFYWLLFGNGLHLRWRINILNKYKNVFCAFFSKRQERWGEYKRTLLQPVSASATP